MKTQILRIIAFWALMNVIVIGCKEPIEEATFSYAENITLPKPLFSESALNRIANTALIPLIPLFVFYEFSEAASMELSDKPEMRQIIVEK